MHHDQLDGIRRALFGFGHGTSDYQGWFEKLFEKEVLFPYLNLYKPDTQTLLYKKGLFGKLAPVFAKQLRITSIINKLIGIDLIGARTQGPSLVEEIAEVVTSEQESRKTLDDRVDQVTTTLRKEGRLFAGLANSINRKETVPPLKNKTRDLTSALVAIEGSLNHVNAMAAFDPALAQSFQQTGAKWILSDVPYFAMRDSRHHSGVAVGVLIDRELERLFEKGVPFLESCGWYPYVTVYGIFREAVSVQRPVKGLELAWLKYRKPKFPDETFALHLDQVLSREQVASNAYLPFLDARPTDVLLFLSAVQLAYQAFHVDFANATASIKTLVTQATQQLRESGAELPANMDAFFAAAA